MIVDGNAANFAQMPIDLQIAAIRGEKCEADGSCLIEQL